MKRRTILATAGAITLVIVTGAAVAAANLGLLDAAADPGAVGGLTPASATAEPQTVTVEAAPQDLPPADGQTAPSPGDDHPRADEDHDRQSGDERYGDESYDRGEQEHYEEHDDDD